MSQNHSDCSAVVSKGVSKYTLSQFFGDDEGPNAIPTWVGKADSAAETLAEKFQTKIEELVKSTKNTVEEMTVVVSSTPDRHKEASKRAREALQKRKQMLSKKRELALDTPPAATEAATT